MQTYNVSRLPSVIKIGWDGENLWRPHSFDCSPLLANHPNGTISLWLLPNGETQAFPVALTRDGNSVVWTPLSEEMTAAAGALQLVCTDGTDVGKSAVVMFRVDESILPGAEHPAAVPSWATQTIERAEDAAERAEEAAESIDIEALEARIAQAVEDYLEEHPIEAPVQSVNGKTGAVTLGASDVGALPANTPIPPAVTVDSALSDSSENPVQNKVINAALDGKGTYTKPSGGIPASDLADDMPFFTLPEGGQSGQALLSDGSNGAYWGDAQSGLSDDAKAALLACFRNVAWINDSGESYLQALSDALDAGDIPVPPAPTDTIPSEYQKVEYIEATGTQVISTDILLGSRNFVVEIDFYKGSQANTSQALVAGNRETSSPLDNAQRWSVSFRTGLKTLGIYSDQWKEFVSDNLYGYKNHIVCAFSDASPYASGTLAANGQTVSFEKTSANYENIGEGNIVFFNVSKNYGSAWCSARLYYCKFTNSGGKIAEFIPCYRKSDSVIGLYEIVSGTFYDNDGTGTFLKGGDVS